MERVKDVLGGKTATLENIVHKMNAKYFGLNYEPIVEEVAAKFALERSQTLVIAYDVRYVSTDQFTLLLVIGGTPSTSHKSRAPLCSTSGNEERCKY